MNIVHISDTHGFHRKVKVPFGQVLIHSGDISNRGEKYQVEDFIDWFVNQPHKYKIFHLISFTAIADITAVN